jgi:hypothetical protein
MTSQLLFALVLLPGSGIPQAAPAPVEQLTPEEKAKLTVRLRTIEIESRHFFRAYEAAMLREMQSREFLRESERQAVLVPNQQANEQLAKAAKAHKDRLADLEMIRQRLEELELERIKLLVRLGKKDTDPPPADPAEPMLEKILDVLIKMEKRLEQLQLRR